MNKVLEHRNFMHPMVRRLSMHSKCLDFFSFKFFLVGGGFCSFFICSQHVPFKFPICSIGSQCVLQGCAQQDLALIPYVLPKVLPFSPTQLGQRGMHLAFHRILSIGKRLSFNFLLQWANQIGSLPKKDGCTSHWLHGNCISKIGCHQFWS